MSLLILSVGHSDVQLRISDSERREIERSLFDDLEQRFSEQTLHVGDTPSTKLGGKVDALPVGAVVCSPKLDAVLDYIVERDGEPSRVLVLETMRTTKREEPRVAGAVVEKRIRGRCPAANVVRVAYLDDQTSTLAGAAQARGQEKRRLVDEQVAKNIHAAIENALQSAGSGAVYVFAGGAMGHIGALVEELAQLLAGPNTRSELLTVSDARKDKLTHEVAVPKKMEATVAEAWRARRQAWELIEQGDFQAAWGAVGSLMIDLEPDWMRRVHWLHQFATSMPIDRDCTLASLSGSRAAKTAIRVEAALRRGDIARAIHGTLAFAESLYWDLLFQEKMIQHSDPKRPTHGMFRAGQEPSSSLNACFKDDGGGYYEPNFHSERKIRRDYLCNQGLNDLEAKLPDRIRKLRHDVAHAEPTPAIMDAAIEMMQAEGLWSVKTQYRADRAPVPRFLTQQIVQESLRQVGLAEPELLFESLLSEVRTVLAKP